MRFPLAHTVWNALVGANATLIVARLLPLPGLDNWRAWPMLLPSTTSPWWRFRSHGGVERGRDHEPREPVA